MLSGTGAAKSFDNCAGKTALSLISSNASGAVTMCMKTTTNRRGIQVGDDVYYSRYRHDYRSCGPVDIDGGRDYTKLVGDIHAAKKVKLIVNKDKLEVVE